MLNGGRDLRHRLTSVYHNGDVEELAEVVISGRSDLMNLYVGQTLA